jgi:hypothetical protein
MRIHESLARIRIRGSKPLTNGSGSDPDPAIFVSDLQDATKNFIVYLLIRYFLKVPVLQIRIRIHRIHMFLGLPDPDPLVRDMDPDPDPALDPDPSIIMQK